MSEFDPYEALGVGPEATTGEIKRAYKARAKTAHPDAGGSADEFDRIGKAYKLLTDQRLRERYDKTGSTEEVTSNTLANAINALGIRFVLALGSPEVEHTDVVRLVRTSIEKDIMKLTGDINEAKTVIEKVKRVQKRIVKKRGDMHDFVKAAYDDVTMDAKRKIMHAEDEIETFRKSLELLKDYECKPAESPLDVALGMLPTGYQRYKPPPKNWNLS